MIAAIAYVQSRPLPVPNVSGYNAVTHDGYLKGLVGTDGARLYFNEFPPGGSAIAQVSITGGEVAHVPLPEPTMSLLDVFPDGATLLVADLVGLTSFQGPLWGLPVLGGSPRRLGDITSQAAAARRMDKQSSMPRARTYSWQRVMGANPANWSHCQISLLILPGRRTAR